MRILLIEDDIHLSGDLKHQFTHEGLDVDVAYDGIAAEKLALRNKYDCILLDVNIPGKNGYDFARSIRQRQIDTPIIMLTAFGEINDKLKGFDAGVDDYMTKPFYFKELLARVKVALKRSEQPGKEDQEILIDNLKIDIAGKMVYRGDVAIKLTAREFELLRLLAVAGGDPVSKKDLLAKVWGSSFEANTNTIEVFINLLRNKIDKNFEPKLIKTRIGFGYYLAKD